MKSLLTLLIIFCGTVPLTAQSTFGTILGSVKDPGGSVIVGVKVTVTNEGTGIAQSTVSDGSGNYEITHLNPGPYTVTAEFPGFQRSVNQHVNLETGRLLRLDISMLVGQITDTVTVEAQAPLIDSETSAVSDVRTGRQMRDLPLNFVRGDAFGGGIFKYMSLSAGSVVGQFGFPRGLTAGVACDSRSCNRQLSKSVLATCATAQAYAI